MIPNRIETKRQRIVRIILTTIGYAIGVAFMALLGAIFWICALFPDYECEAIFDAVRDAIWAR